MHEITVIGQPDPDVVRMILESVAEMLRQEEAQRLEKDGAGGTSPADVEDWDNSSVAP